MAAILGGSSLLQGSLGGGSLMEIIDSRGDIQNSLMSTSSSYTPPRPTLLSRSQHSITTTITVAPARSSVAGKRRKRGRRRPDAGDGGGDDDGGSGGGGFWSGGGGDDEEDNGWGLKAQNLWIWQAISVCGLLQAVQYLASEQRQSSPQPEQMASALVH